MHEFDIDEQDLITIKRKQRKYQQFTLAAVIVSAVVVICLLMGLFAQARVILTKIEKTPTNSGPTTTTGTTQDVTDEYLEKFSKQFLGAMDDSVDPCVDFYQYSCGTWIKNTRLPGDKSSYTKSFSTISEENEKLLQTILESDWPLIGPFYQNCMDLDTINEVDVTPLAPWLSLIASVSDKDSLMTTLGKLHNYSYSGFFGFWVDADMKNPEWNIPYLWQGGLGLPDMQYYQGDQTAALRAKYVQHIAKSLMLIGATSEEANTQATKIMEIETRLAGESLPPDKLRDDNAVYHKFTYTQLTERTPTLKWDNYFSALGAPQFTELIIGMPEFISEVETILSDTDFAWIRAYMKWNLLRSTFSQLSQRFLDEQFAWSQALYGTKEPTARWKKCISYTNSLMGELLGRYFVDQHFPGSSKTIAQKLVKALEDSFSENLKGLDWMDKTTKDLAQNKLTQITNKIGYPDKWTSYDSIVISPKKFFENVEILQNFDVSQMVQRIGTKVDKSRWLMTPSTVNAYYNPTGNEIVFPAAILQPPFFSQSNPAWSNFGSIGAVIGHEITHGFDDQGRQFDAKGNLSNWWTENSAEQFASRADCVENYYSKYEVLSGLYINGKLTEGENLADMGGIRIAYDAWLQWIAKNQDIYSDKLISKYFPGLTSEQLFFLSFGQVWCSVETDQYKTYLTTTNPHSLPKYRVLGSLSNFDKFWNAFQCGAGTPMHPKATCRVW